MGCACMCGISLGAVHYGFARFAPWHRCYVVSTRGGMAGQGFFFYWAGRQGCMYTTSSARHFGGTAFASSLCAARGQQQTQHALSQELASSQLPPAFGSTPCHRVLLISYWVCANGLHFVPIAPQFVRGIRRGLQAKLPLACGTACRLKHLAGCMFTCVTLHTV
jgi:hypothetical protein